MKWYQMNQKQIEQKLSVDVHSGLSEEQVEQRKKLYGLNELMDQKRLSKWIIFFKQFQDFMVLLLLAATLIAGLLGEYIDAIAIIIIVMINGIIGFFQEQRAEQSLEKLKTLSAPLANVLREESWQKVRAEHLVIGDVVRLSRGNRVPADIRIVHSSGLECDEAVLTGESLPVAKHEQPIMKEPLAASDQENMCFKGTLVTHGSALGIVVGTGMETAMGQIAKLMATTKKTLTPLELKLRELGKVLIIVVLILIALIVSIGIIQGHPTYQMFLAGVSLAVAAIPEGLPAIVTVVLSLGVQRMIRQRAIIRKLSAVETLGAASVICSDKTGTITENKMTVKRLFLNGEFIEVTGSSEMAEGDFYLNNDKLKAGHPNLSLMLHYGILCNHAQLLVKNGKYVIDGDPTDGALQIVARKFGLDHTSFENYKIIKEIPFDAKRKRMSVIIEDANKRRFLITKGAPDILLPRSTYMLTKEGSRLLKEPKVIEKAIDQMADNALRTLAICMKPLTATNSLQTSSLEKELTFIGLYGMIDPPRQEVKQAINECQQAGIQTVMITGDHVKTASAIAKQIGLLQENSLIVDGHWLDQVTMDELVDVVEDIAVFARVTPEHKLKIVHAFQQKGHVVAMTGDGVNDAPAIKASDIGISMGISGTDVTKEAASLILMDDNFATIKSAIKEGRIIYDNIRKFIRYLLASNVGEILVVLLAMLFGYPLPLVPVQILWVNLVTDGLPAMALGVDQAEEDVMKRKPRDTKEGIFARRLGHKIISRGILIGIVSLMAFMMAFQNDMEQLTHARTMAFATLVIAQLIHVYDCRNERSIFDRNPLQNKYLNIAVLSSVVLLLCVIYIQSLQPIFHTTALNITDWLLVIALSLFPSVFFGFRHKGK